MGWSFFDNPRMKKDAVIADLTRDANWLDGWRAVRWSYTDGELYILIERNNPEGKGVEHEIARYLIKGGGPGSGWGWKGVPVREGCGAPEYMLAKALDPGYYGDWIEEVRKHRREQAALAKRVKAAHAGMEVVLENRRFRLQRPAASSGWIVEEIATQDVYRMRVSQLRMALAGSPMQERAVEQALAWVEPEQQQLALAA